MVTVSHNHCKKEQRCTLQKKVNYEEDLKLKLPEPKGYKLLIAIPKVEEKTEIWRLYAGHSNKNGTNSINNRSCR